MTPLDERFLLHDNGPDADKIALIFATNIGLSLIANAATWFIDKISLTDFYIST